MMESTTRQGTRAAGAMAVFVSRIAMLAAAFALPPALAAGPASGGAPKGNPRVANLQIEIWPEYDRPAALVILKGELTAETTLPATVSLRIAASSGGPSAVAASTGLDGKLFNLKYERENAGDFIMLRMEVPGRLFHVEFYDPLATRAADRDYTYVWPGDMAVNRLSVVVQEPAAASNVSVQPNLAATATGQNGLRYRSADFGAVEAGKRQTIRVRYTKTDSRTSSEILQLNTPDSSSLPATDSGKPPFGWFVVLGVAPVLLVGAGAALIWWRRRRKAFSAQTGGAGFCPKCGNQPGPGDRFCSKCGRALR